MLCETVWVLTTSSIQRRLTQEEIESQLYAALPKDLRGTIDWPDD